MTDEDLKIQVPSQGWEQFLTGRKAILDAYDRGRKQARAHEVETYHGKVVEAEFRRWLGEFLPKRYAVTPGYIVSTGFRSTDRAPHFDVIIYDHLESPVLWVEDNPDSSKQGRSRAIPVEYVHSVVEVKSAFSTKAATDAIEHLSDLSPLMKSIDQPSERYKLHLPPRFCCGIVFAEMRTPDATSDLGLSKMVNGMALRNFFGGLVLRGEGHTAPVTGRIVLTQSEEPMDVARERQGPFLLEWGHTKTMQVADKIHVGAMISWAEYEFARFAFDLLALIQGTYEPGRVSSFYGFGSSFMEIASRAAKPDGKAS
jgi:hypothetical protein